MRLIILCAAEVKDPCVQIQSVPGVFVIRTFETSKNTVVVANVVEGVLDAKAKIEDLGLWLSVYESRV